MALTRIKATLNVAAYDYAHAAVGAAQVAYTAASDAEPCVVVWRSIVEAQHLMQKSNDALAVCLSATNLLLNAERVEEEEINHINAQVKADTIEQHVIASMLEGATARLELTKRMFPENPAPGARCIPEQVM